MLCRSPATERVGWVDVKISLNGVDYNASKAKFLFVASAKVFGLNPSVGPVRGGTMVMVSGSGFNVSQNIRCWFGTLWSLPQVISNFRIRCRSTASIPGDVQFRVSESGNTNGVSHQFLFVLEAVISLITPTIGSAQGGTVLTILGLHFLPEHRYCRFGDSGSTRVDYVSSTRLSCVAPQMQSFYEVDVHLILSSTDEYGAGPITFTYSAPVSLFRLQPSVGPVSGGRIVTAFGDFSGATGSYRCLFGVDTMPASFLSPSTLLCASPQRLRAGNVSFAVASHDDLVVSERLEYSFESSGRVISLFPRKGPTVGGTRLTMTVSGLKKQSTLRCYVGQYLVDSSVEGGRVVCTTPSHDTGQVAVTLFDGDECLSGAGLMFEMVQSPIALAISPTHGTDAGGTKVLILGRHFAADSTDTCCRFGNKEVHGTVLSKSELYCKSPAVRGLVSVEVSTNCADYSISSIQFLFRSPLEIYEVKPSSGDTLRNLSVTLFGKNFVNTSQLRCRFNDSTAQEVRAIYQSSSMLQTTLPLLPDGGYTIAISSNGYDFFGSRVLFRAASAQGICSVRPSWSWTRGGQDVTVSGIVFGKGSAYECRFGSRLVAARLVSLQDAACSVPETDIVGIVDLKISKGSLSKEGAEFCESTFEYREASGVWMAKSFKIKPTAGPVSGGTVLTVHVSDIVAGSKALCVFSGALKQPAFQLHDGLLSCSTPHNVLGLVEISLEVDGTVVDGKSKFLFENRPAIMSIEPTVGGVDSNARVLITVFGLGFSERDALSCRVGLQKCVATYLSSTLVLMEMKNLHAGNHSVEVSNNGADYSQSGIKYHVLEGLKVLRLVPSIGSVQGGNVVVVLGRGMIGNSQKLSCLFGDHSSKGIRVSDSEVRCVAPASTPGLVLANLQAGTEKGESVAWYLYTIGEARVDALFPSEGDPESPTLVNVTGSFFSVSDSKCRVAGEETVAHRAFSSTLITCLVPAYSNHISSVLVEPLGIDNLFSISDFPFIFIYRNKTISSYAKQGTSVDYNHGHSLISLHPTWGSAAGGYLIDVSGVFFNAFESWSCKFTSPSSELSSLALFHSSSKISCVAPNFDSANQSYVKVISSSSSYIFVSSTPFIFYMDPIVYIIFPSRGLLGSISITVVGLNFVSGAMTCAFGDLIGLKSAVYSSTLLKCFVPPAPDIGMSGAVEVSANRVDYTKNGVQFVNVARPQVSGINPQRGFASEALSVSVYGSFSYAASDVRCLWGSNLIISGTAVTSSLILCSGGGLGRGNYTVEVSVHGDDYSRNGHRFEIVDFLSIRRIIPSSGPVKGSELIRVLVAGLIPQDYLECRFSESRAPASVVSDKEVVCTTPRGDAGRVRFKLGSGADETQENIFYEYTRQNIAAVYQVSPSIGVCDGGTLIEVIGVGLKFEEGIGIFGRASNRVPCSGESSLAVRCKAPAHEAGKVTVEAMGLDGQFTRSEVGFLFHARPVLLGMDPAVLRWTDSGEITVYGEHFIFSPSFGCKVGDIELFVVSTWINSQQAVCRVPRMGSHVVAVRVTNNGEDYSMEPLLLKYLVKLELLNVIPSMGTFTGGTILDIVGMNFDSYQETGLSCIFNSVLLSSGSIVSSSHITCSNPHCPHGARHLESEDHAGLEYEERAS